MPSTLLSVIIPCYNAGDVLLDAINSVQKNCSLKDYEIIITDDGSNQADTLQILELLLQQGYTVLHQENKGPAAARNNCIQKADGEFLFLLDSDNRLRKGYIEKSIDILNADSNIGVVYGKPNFFGDMIQPRFEVRPFNLHAILLNNYIDTCSIIRKSLWQDLGGFDESKTLVGHEDWEFWLRVYKSGKTLFFIDEELYDYRLKQGSLVTRVTEEENHMRMWEYVYIKHIDLFIKTFRYFGSQYFIYQEDMEKPLRSFAKYFHHKYVDKNS